MTWLSSRRCRHVLGLLAILSVFFGWELLARFEVINPVYLPPPSEILKQIPGQLVHGPLPKDLGTSLFAVSVGVGVSLIVGSSMATLASSVIWVRWFVSPIIELMRGIAPLALLPAFLLLFGLGISSEIAIICWVSWVPIYINLLQGLDSTDPELLTAARSMGATFRTLVLTVHLPSISGDLLTGVRLAFGNAWLAVVAAEMLGANAGMGYRILEFSQTFRVTDMYGAILVIGFTSLTINGVFVFVHDRVARWKTNAT